MNAPEKTPAGYETFLYQETIPGVSVEDGNCLLFNFWTTDIAQVKKSLLPTDNVSQALKAVNFFHNPEKTTESKDDRLAKLCLILTAFCNMRCVYCYNDSGQYKTFMPFPVAQVAIDEILKREGIDILLLELYGGEPTLNPQCLKQSVIYTHKTSPIPVLPFVVTNGTMGQSTLKCLIENKACFVISFDVLRSIHDRQRPLRNGTSCYEQVIENIKRVVDAGRKVSIRSVITNLNVHRMVEMVRIASNLGVEEIILGPCEINVGRARQSQKITRPRLDDYVRNYILAVREADKMNIRVIDHLHRLLHAKDSRRSEILFVLPDGKVT